MSYICQFPDCGRIANFGYEKKGMPIYCPLHRAENMIEIKKDPKKCDTQGCKKTAKYKKINEEDGTVIRACSLHKREDMVPLPYYKCSLCDRKGIYYTPDNMREKFCHVHKSKGMICNKTRLCEEDDCMKIARYNYKEKNTPLYCRKHKKNEMVDVIFRYENEYKNTKCQECDEDALYNYYPPAMYCRKHKKDNMIVVAPARCLECGKRANFNYPDSKPGIYCSVHKLKGMVNIYAPKCRECDKIAYYGPKETRERFYCATHKKTGMVANNAKICLECDRTAKFNYEGEKPKYCEIHKKDNMVNVSPSRCRYPGCTRFAKYRNKNNTSLRFCRLHKLKGMTMKSICSVEGCERRAIYSFEGSRRTKFCELHKKKGMINREEIDSDDPNDEASDKLGETNTDPMDLDEKNCNIRIKLYMDIQNEEEIDLNAAPNEETTTNARKRKIEDDENVVSKIPRIK
jgi:hypothetical protein